MMHMFFSLCRAENDSSQMLLDQLRRKSSVIFMHKLPDLTAKELLVVIEKQSCIISINKRMKSFVMENLRKFDTATHITLLEALSHRTMALNS